MPTVTIRTEVEVVINCTKKAAKLYEDEGDTSELDQHLERLEAVIETAVVKLKGYDSHDMSSEIESAETDE